MIILPLSCQQTAPAVLLDNRKGNVKACRQGGIVIRLGPAGQRGEIFEYGKPYEQDGDTGRQSRAGRLQARQFDALDLEHLLEKVERPWKPEGPTNRWPLREVRHRAAREA